jgi:hypothetical protein
MCPNVCNRGPTPDRRGFPKQTFYIDTEPRRRSERRRGLSAEGATVQEGVQPQWTDTDVLLRYTQSLIPQMAQTAVCNRHHSVD